MSLIEKIKNAIRDCDDPGEELAHLFAQAALTAIMDAGDGVQQDMLAANELLIGEKVGGGDGGTYVLRCPGYKETLQAFARHRSTAAAAERARIVAWLRDGGPEPKYTMDLHDTGDIADAIERGEV